MRAALNFFQNKTTRDLVFQIVFLVFLLLVLWTGIQQISESLVRQGLPHGFEFLKRSTGWDIGFSTLSFSPNDTYARALLVGFTNTLILGTLGLLGATFFGLAFGIARTVNHKLLNQLGMIYVDVLRNIPLILQAFFWYAVLTRLPPPRQAIDILGTIYISSRGWYMPILNINLLAGLTALLAGIAAITGMIWLMLIASHPRGVMHKRAVGLASIGVALIAFALTVGHPAGTPWFDLPKLTGLNFTGGLQVPPEMTALFIAMSLYGGAFIAEIIRSGYATVPRGTTEAGLALGLSGFQTFLLIRSPLAIRAILPILTNQYVWLVKATTLGIAVGFSDFFMIISTSINHSGQTLELIAILMLGFLGLNFTIARLMGLLIRHLRVPGFGGHK